MVYYNYKIKKGCSTMTERMKKFTSIEQYEKWTEGFENASDYEEFPVMIDTGFKISTDMFTTCKSYKTALKRFEKTFGENNKVISEWVECMRESCENGYFKDLDGWKPAWLKKPEEIEEYRKSGTYSWGVENVSENCWYIFLNISGGYVNRENV